MDAAHELKTAIAVVRSSVQLLMLRRRTPDEYAAGLVQVLKDNSRVEELVTQMLQLAGLEQAIAPGAGISPETLSHVFERFIVKNGRGRGRERTGLGLATCKSIVEGAGGTILIESTPGQGTRATVTFPAA